MLACDQTITIVQHVANAEGDSYACTVCHGASWFAKTNITTSGDGAKPSATYEVRIMGAVGGAFSLGDYVVRGEIAEVGKPADLKSREHFRITSIGDNRRGILPHWRLSGQ